MWSLYFYLCMLFVLCDSLSLSTCKLEILNGADPLSLASAIGDWTSSALGIGSLELYNISISATVLPWENELKKMPRKPRKIRNIRIKKSRNLLLIYLKAGLRLFCRSGKNISSICIRTVNVTVTLIGIVAWLSNDVNIVISVSDSGGVSVKS